MYNPNTGFFCSFQSKYSLYRQKEMIAVATFLSSLYELMVAKQMHSLASQILNDTYYQEDAPFNNNNRK